MPTNNNNASPDSLIQPTQPAQQAPAQPAPAQPSAPAQSFFSKLINPNQLPSSQLFRGILAAGLTGLAGGVAANRNGSPGALGAFAGGISAEMGQNQQAQLHNEQMQQQMFENKQKQEATNIAKQREQSEAQLNAAVQQKTLQEVKNLQESAEQMKAAGDLDKKRFGLEMARARQSAAEQYDNLLKSGYKPVNGLEFHDSHEAMQWATQHPDQILKSPNGTDFGLVVSYDPDFNDGQGGYKLLEGEGREYRTLKLPDGKEVEVYATSSEYFNMLLQQQGSQDRHSLDLADIALRGAQSDKEKADTRYTNSLTTDAGVPLNATKEQLGKFRTLEKAMHDASVYYQNVSNTEPKDSPRREEARQRYAKTVDDYDTLLRQISGGKEDTALNKENQAISGIVKFGQQAIDSQLQSGASPAEIQKMIAAKPVSDEVKQTLLQYLKEKAPAEKKPAENSTGYNIWDVPNKILGAVPNIVQDIKTLPGALRPH